MKPLNRGRGVFFIDDEAEIDVGRAMRNHEDVDVRETAERSPRDARRVFQIVADETYERGLGCDLYLPELPEVFHDGMQRRNVVERQ